MLRLTRTLGSTTDTPGRLPSVGHGLVGDAGRRGAWRLIASVTDADSNPIGLLQPPK